MSAINYLRNGLKIRHFRLVMALDQYRQIARVANALHISQPAVSKALAELEDGLGYELFVRHPRGLEPTPYGACLIKYAQTIMGDLERASDELLAIGQGSSTMLAVGVMHGTSISILPEALDRLKKNMPELNITVVESSMDVLLGQLRRGQLDVVLGATSPRVTADDIAVHYLYQDVIKVVVGVSHSLANQRAVDWATLQQYSWVLPPRAAGLRISLEQALHRIGLEVPQHQVQTLSPSLTLGMLDTGRAVAFMTGRLADVYAKRGLIKMLPLEVPDLRLSFSIQTLKSVALNFSVEQFIACVEAAIAG